TLWSNGGQSIAEIYTTEKSEMMLSHDFGMKGDQIYPKLATSGTNTYAVWLDNRSAVSNTVTSDSNIFMQQFDTNGLPQWPASTYQAGYGTPYTAMDIRADTYAGAWGTHYSGKPAIGGIFNHSDGSVPLTLAWEDNRTSGDPMDIFSQAYDTTEQDISKSTSWTVYFDVNQVATLAVKVGIMEWDGTTPVLESGANTWNSCSPACPSEQSSVFPTGGSPAPPSDTIGNISMRRLIVEFTRTNGSATIYYDNSTDDSCGTGQDCDSRLGTGGDVVPERVLFLGLIIPFLPPVIRWYNRRRRRVKQTLISTDIS
ncbi:MAG: hypothetical protein U1D67_04625, partial [Dehalococcoidia bacterium]|nr:hypothetical protein [Dehalococcoidia bacterium]